MSGVRPVVVTDAAHGRRRCADRAEAFADASGRIDSQGDNIRPALAAAARSHSERAVDDGQNTSGQPHRHRSVARHVRTYVSIGGIGWQVPSVRPGNRAKPLAHAFGFFAMEVVLQHQRRRTRCHGRRCRPGLRPGFPVPFAVKGDRQQPADVADSGRRPGRRRAWSAPASGRRRRACRRA